jgi:hypothetical protein
MRLRWLLTCIVFLALLAPLVAAAPSLTYPRVTPSSGEPGDAFTFTVHYRGDAPAQMEVVIGGTAHQMSEVDPSDDNVTDGKDYYFEVELPEGTHIFFFKATVDSETVVRTPSSTLLVGGEDWMHFTHLDVVLAVLVFLVPVALALIMFRRFSKRVEELLGELGKRKE